MIVLLSMLLLGSSLGSVTSLPSGFCWVLKLRVVVRSRGEGLVWIMVT
jgi:hypothetical protein